MSATPRNEGRRLLSSRNASPGSRQTPVSDPTPFLSPGESSPAGPLLVFRHTSLDAAQRRARHRAAVRSGGATVRGEAALRARAHGRRPGRVPHGRPWRLHDLWGRAVRSDLQSGGRTTPGRCAQPAAVGAGWDASRHHRLRHRAFLRDGRILDPDLDHRPRHPTVAGRGLGDIHRPSPRSADARGGLQLLGRDLYARRSQVLRDTRHGRRDLAGDRATSTRAPSR